MLAPAHLQRLRAMPEAFAAHAPLCEVPGDAVAHPHLHPHEHGHAHPHDRPHDPPTARAPRQDAA